MEYCKKNPITKPQVRYSTLKYYLKIIHTFIKTTKQQKSNENEQFSDGK